MNRVITINTLIKLYLTIFIIILSNSNFSYSKGKNPFVSPAIIPVEKPSTLDDEIKWLEYQKKNDPSMLELEKFTRNYINNFLDNHKKQNNLQASFPDTSCVMTIPIVFHVFHPNGEAGVPFSQIEFAINDLNKTFAGQNEDFETVNPAFKDIKSYTKIRFALAKIDPKGNTTNGIVYYKDRQSGFADGSGLVDSMIASIAWDNYKYFNVYVMNDLFGNNVTNNSGFCYYPSTYMSDRNTARMVYNYSYLGQGGSSYNNLEFNQTFTHECGHYLNLQHTFEGGSCFGANDNCDDTPPTNVAGGGCNSVICGALINGENYMDYNANCYKNFTNDQNLRMEAAINSPARFPLWQYDNLIATGIIDNNESNECINQEPFFAFTKLEVNEDIDDLGKIGELNIMVYTGGGLIFKKSDYVLIEGEDYTVSNVPNGLTFNIMTSIDKKYAMITFEGNALNHDYEDSIDDLIFTFTNNAIESNQDIKNIKNNSVNIKVLFNDFKFRCGSPNLTVDNQTKWTPFFTSGKVPKNYGLLYKDASYYFESYGRGLITTSLSSDTIVFLQEGQIIDGQNQWRQGGAAALIYSPNFTELDNKIGYVGFQMQIGKDFHYGWMKLDVSSETGVTILEYQYNEMPNAPITVGVACDIANSIENETTYLNESNYSIYPNPIENTFEISNFTSELIGGNIKIYSIEGIEISEMEITNHHQTFDISNYNRGVFIIQILNKMNNIISNQVVIKK